MPKPPKTEQARRLVASRVRAGFASAKDAAEHFGWSPETYGQHERGYRNLRWSVAKAYADAFRIPHDWLMVEPGAAGPSEAINEAPPERRSTWDIAAAGTADRNLAEAAALKMAEYVLVAQQMGDPLAPEKLRQLAELAAQRVLVERARPRLLEQALPPLPHRSAAHKD